MNNIINFSDIRRDEKNSKALTVMPDISHELTIPKHKSTALTIKEKVGKVIDLQDKKEQLLKDENNAYDISYGIAKILNLPVGKLLSLRNEHDNIISGIADDYNLKQVA